MLYTFVAWTSTQADSAAAEKAREEASSEDADPYEDLRFAEEGDGTTGAMVKVGVPLFLTVIYGGILTVLYVLPMFVDRLSQEMMGSTAEVDDDPLNDARAAVAAGDYPEAIQVYRKVWLTKPEDRYPVVEIAKIQRTQLNNPAVAVSTLKEALDEHEWEEDDQAFFLFRIAEIYEEDLEDKEKLVVTLKRAAEELEGTRHAANAQHKLRELGVG